MLGVGGWDIVHEQCHHAIILETNREDVASVEVVTDKAELRGGPLLMHPCIYLVSC